MIDAQVTAAIALCVRQAARVKPHVAIEPETRLVEDLAIDSLDLVGVYLQIQDEFGVDIDDQDVPGLRTVADLARYVASRSNSAAA